MPRNRSASEDVAGFGVGNFVRWAAAPTSKGIVRKIDKNRRRLQVQWLDIPQTSWYDHSRFTGDDPRIVRWVDPHPKE